MSYAGFAEQVIAMLDSGLATPFNPA
jgi:hypothetical protein